PQIPSGQRVAAPVEGKEGEPNTFGGYLLLLIAVAGGIALETARLKTRAIYLGLAGLMAIPFMFTLSRTSYVGAIPAVAAIAALTSRRRLMIIGFIVMIVASPAVFTLLPESVTRRVHYTFQPERGQPTVRVGTVGLDPSTSAPTRSSSSASWSRSGSSPPSSSRYPGSPRRRRRPCPRRSRVSPGASPDADTRRRRTRPEDPVARHGRRRGADRRPDDALRARRRAEGLSHPRRDRDRAGQASRDPDRDGHRRVEPDREGARRQARGRLGRPRRAP